MNAPRGIVNGLLLFGGLVVAGFAAFALAWRGAAGTLDVANQVPYVVSGGLGGLALVVVGSALLYVHVSRLLVAHEIEDAQDLMDLLGDLAERAEGGS